MEVWATLDHLNNLLTLAYNTNNWSKVYSVQLRLAEIIDELRKEGR